MKALTENSVKSTKPPEIGKIELSDAAMPGLRLRVAASGRKTFIFEKRVRGTKKKRTITLGVYGPAGLSLKEARDKAADLSKELDAGTDVVAERKAAMDADAARVSVAEALELYNLAELSRLRRGAERRRDLDRAFEGYETMSLAEIERSHIREMINRRRTGVRGKPTPRMAELIRAAMSAFFNWASSEDDERAAIISQNPMTGLRKSKSGASVKRDRLLSIDELGAIWRASYEMGVWGPAIRLMMLTGQRRQIILALPWDEVNLFEAVIITPGERMKNGQPDMTPLSTPALTELQELHAAHIARKKARDRRDAPRGFVFTTTGTTPISGVSKAKKRLDGLVTRELKEHGSLGDGESMEPWVFHDFRRGLSTHMNEFTSGQSRYVVDRALNHTAMAASGAEANYKLWQADELLDERRMILEAWAGLIKSENRESENAVPLGLEGRK